MMFVCKTWTVYLLGIIIFLEIVKCVKGNGDTNRFRLSSLHELESAKRPKLMDVYSNHPSEEEVEDHFYKLHPKAQFITKRRDTLDFPDMEKWFSASMEDSLLESEHGHFEKEDLSSIDSDRNKYVYSKRPLFHTQLKTPLESDQKPLIFIETHQMTPDTENYGSFYVPSENDQDSRPLFYTKKHNFSWDYAEIPSELNSYVQIKHRTATTTTSTPDSIKSSSNRYEEVDLTTSNNNLNENQSGNNDTGTREKIKDTLKKYLAKFLIEKYGKKKPTISKRNNETFAIRNHRKYLSHPNINKHPKIEQESKFLYSNALWDLKNKTVTKLKQFFSLFTIIKFNNTECNATNWAGTWQGVCLTSAECTQQNGTALGNCANGFGVCCVFRGSCGDSSSRNCSYFKSPNYPDYYPSDGTVITPTTTVAPTPFPTPDPRLYWYYYNREGGDTDLDNIMMGRQSTSDTLSCIFRVYKTNSNVQQFRIDFIDLDVTNVTMTTNFIRQGNEFLTHYHKLASPTNGTCTIERLVISGQNSNDQIPVLCGYNTGQHVYVDVSQLSGPLQIMILSTTGTRKRFKMKICQFTDTCLSSQSNCLQYYTGVTGVIESFNYDQAAMFNRSTPGYFNNLNYAICIRREAGYCSITYSNVQGTTTYPFQLVNRLPNGQLTVPAGQAGVDILNCPDDYIIIDGTRLCGDRFNDGSTTSNFSLNAAVVDTSSGPIVINVRTNNNVTGLGFKLFYTQNPCT